MKLNYLSENHMSRSLTPEKLLWAAVLHDALRLIVFEHESSECERKDALIWWKKGDTRLGGSLWICHTLGLNYGWIRSRIALKEVQLCSIQNAKRSFR